MAGFAQPRGKTKAQGLVTLRASVCPHTWEAPCLLLMFLQLAESLRLGPASQSAPRAGEPQWRLPPGPFLLGQKTGACPGSRSLAGSEGRASGTCAGTCLPCQPDSGGAGPEAVPQLPLHLSPTFPLPRRGHLVPAAEKGGLLIFLFLLKTPSPLDPGPRTSVPSSSLGPHPP